MRNLLAIALGAVALLGGDPGAHGLTFDLPALLTITRDQDTLPPPAVLPSRPGSAEERGTTGRKVAPPAGATSVEQPAPGLPGPSLPALPARAVRSGRSDGKRGLAHKGGGPAPKRGSAKAPEGPPATATAKGPALAPPPQQLTTALTPGPSASSAAAASAPRPHFVPEPIAPEVPSTILRLRSGETPGLR